MSQFYFFLKFSEIMLTTRQPEWDKDPFCLYIYFGTFNSSPNPLRPQSMSHYSWCQLRPTYYQSSNSPLCLPLSQLVGGQLVGTQTGWFTLSNLYGVVNELWWALYLPRSVRLHFKPLISNIKVSKSNRIFNICREVGCNIQYSYTEHVSS